MRKLDLTPLLRPLVFGRCQRLRDRLELSPESRHVVLDDVADDVLLDVKVGVGEDHPDASDLSPGDLRMCLLGPVRHIRGSLTQHLDPPLRCCLDHRVLSEPAQVRSVLDEEITHLEHVEDAVVIAPHRSTASASTR